MSNGSIEVTHVLPVSPERIYNAWLDAKEHSKFTGRGTTIEPKVGGRFTAFDGHVEGHSLVLEPHRHIIQSWRSNDFPRGADDSKVEILLDAVPEGTRFTVRHTQIPESQVAVLKKGWAERYFEPMSRYFSAAGR